MCRLHSTKKITEDENLPRYSPLIMREDRSFSSWPAKGVFSLFPNFSILPQVYFRFSWLLKRLKRSGIGAWAGACSQTAWTAAGRHGQGMILYRVSLKCRSYSSVLPPSFIWIFTGVLQLIFAKTYLKHPCQIQKTLLENSFNCIPIIRKSTIFPIICPMFRSNFVSTL